MPLTTLLERPGSRAVCCSWSCLPHVHQERLVLRDHRVAVADVRRQVVSHRAGGQAHPAVVPRHAHLMDSLTVDVQRLPAAGDQGHYLDLSARRTYDDLL